MPTHCVTTYCVRIGFIKVHLTVYFATYPVAVGSILVVGNHPVAAGSPGVGTLLEKDSLLARTYNKFDIRDTPGFDDLRSAAVMYLAGVGSPFAVEVGSPFAAEADSLGGGTPGADNRVGRMG
jgi:hypothetical protein